MGVVRCGGIVEFLVIFRRENMILMPTFYEGNDSVASEHHGTGFFENLGKGSILGG